MTNIACRHDTHNCIFLFGGRILTVLIANDLQLIEVFPVSQLLKEVNQVIQAEGGRMTAQRRIILSALESCGGHPTAEEIYQAAKASDPTLNLSTVYRTLRWLERLDLVSTHQFDDGRHLDRFDASLPQEHHHFRCRQCNRIIEFSDERIEQIKADFAAAYACEVDEASLVLNGLCHRCASKIA